MPHVITDRELRAILSSLAMARPDLVEALELVAVATRLSKPKKQPKNQLSRQPRLQIEAETH